MGQVHGFKNPEPQRKKEQKKERSKTIEHKTNQNKTNLGRTISRIYSQNHLTCESRVLKSFSKGKGQKLEIQFASRISSWKQILVWRYRGDSRVSFKQNLHGISTREFVSTTRSDWQIEFRAFDLYLLRRFREPSIRIPSGFGCTKCAALSPWFACLRWVSIHKPTI